MYIMITRKSYFIFVLSAHPVSITLSRHHDVATEESREGDASLHTHTHTEDHRAQFYLPVSIKCQLADPFLQYSFTTTLLDPAIVRYANS